MNMAYMNKYSIILMTPRTIAIPKMKNKATKVNNKVKKTLALGLSFKLHHH